MSRIAARLTLSLCLLAVPLLSAAAAPIVQWSYRVDPGTGSAAPAVRAQARGGVSDITTTLSVLTAETSGVLQTSIARSTSSLHVLLPDTGQDTFVEVALSTGTALNDAEPFRWLTVARPAGKRLMDYGGLKDLLPPEDFDKFWARAKKELGAVPALPKVTRVPDRDSSSGLLFQVELSSVQDATIVGWLFVPREAYPNGDTDRLPTMKYPALLIAPGHKGDQRPVDRTANGYVTFAINPRNHGPSRAFWKSPVDHMFYNLTDHENYYYKLAFLDCVRAAEFLLEREEVDPKRVGAEGSSQGGLFALATAALEPRIACVTSHVIAFSAMADGAVLATRGGQTSLAQLMNGDQTTAPAVRRSLSYIDGANMATRVKCPVQINMAGQDTVSPYVCGIVVHNRLPKSTVREFHVLPDAGHEVTSEMRKWSAAWQKRWLGR